MAAYILVIPPNQCWYWKRLPVLSSSCDFIVYWWRLSGVESSSLELDWIRLICNDSFRR